MKRTFVLILTTLIIVSLGDRGIGLYLSQKYEENYCVHAGGDLHAYLKGRSYDIVFVGSSRVNTMINPELISKNAVNVAKPAKHLYYHVAVIDLMDQYGKLPKKKLVLNVEVEDVFLTLRPRLISDVSYLKYYYHSNSLIREIINKNGPLEHVKYYFDCYRFNGENFTVFTNPFQSICTSSEKGFYPLPKGENDQERLLQGIKEMGMLNASGFNPEVVMMLNHVKKICRKNNIALTILYGPNYRIPGVFGKGSQIFEKLCKEMDLHFINFSSQYKDTFNDIGLWYDHIHLNSEATTKYTLLLKEELEEPTTEDRRIIH